MSQVVVTFIMMRIPATIFIVVVSSLATTHAVRLGPEEVYSLEVVKPPVVGFSLNVSITPLNEEGRVIVELVNNFFIFSRLDIHLKKQFVLIPDSVLLRGVSRVPSFYDISVNQYDPRPFPFALGKKFTLEIVASSSYTWEYRARGDNWEQAFSHTTRLISISQVKEVIFYGGVDLKLLGNNI